MIYILTMYQMTVCNENNRPTLPALRSYFGFMAFHYTLPAQHQNVDKES